MRSIRSFYLKLMVFSIFTLAFLFAWTMYMSERYQSDLTWLLWLFFVGSTALIHYILAKVANTQPRKFVGYFMGITGIKLFVYLIIIVLYALLKREAALGFTLQFLVLYLLYSGFEVVMLLKQFKN